jgi:two-component system sensor histidine kinase RpfC
MTPNYDRLSKPEASASPEVGIEARLEPNRFRILIADDQDANRLILAKLLKLTGYLTVEVGDGKEALQCILSQPLDLAIMDVEMPIMSGLEAIRQIRKLDDPRIASLPVLAATGNPQAEIERDLLDAGANAFLTKPFDTLMLLKTIADLLSPSPGPSPLDETSGQGARQFQSMKNVT